MQKIAIVNHKGGVGKTTLAVNIAFYYKENMKQLLLVDYDGQHNSMDLFSGYSWNGEEIWYDNTELIALTPVMDSRFIKNYPADVIFDCPPSIEANGDFIKYLYSTDIMIDIWLVPVEDRTSISGAATIHRNIKNIFPNARVIYVPYNVPNNNWTQRDRAEIMRYSDVEIYNQVIPRYSQGISQFRQEGGLPIWEFYKRTRFASAMKEFCYWVYNGCFESSSDKKRKHLGTFRLEDKIKRKIKSEQKQFIEMPSNRRRKYVELILENKLGENPNE